MSRIIKQSLISQPIKEQKEVVKLSVSSEEYEKWKSSAQCSSTENLKNIIKQKISENKSLEDITKSLTLTNIILQEKIKTLYFELITTTPPELNLKKEEEEDEEEEDTNEIITSSIETDETLEAMDKFNEENTDDIIEENTDDIIETITPEILEINKYRDEIQLLYHNEIILELDTNKNALLKAPTGFGKTVIIFKIINHYSPKITLFLTPRRNLNNQTMIDKEKYLTNGNYIFYNYSPDEDEKTKILTRKDKGQKIRKFIRHRLRENMNIILVSCFQSCSSLLPLLYNYNIQINLVICDEAHFIDNWGLLKCETHRFLLDDRKLKDTETPFIEKRLFATATPKEIMNEGKFIPVFGKKIEKVQIYELINNKVLCDFEVIIKEFEEDKIPEPKAQLEDEDIAIVKIKTTKKLKKQLKPKKPEKLKLDLAHLIYDCMIEKKKKKGIIYLNSQHRVKHFYAYFKRTYPEFDVFIYISDKLTQRTFNELKTPDGNGYTDIVFNPDHTNINKFKQCEKPCIIITCNKLSYGFDELKVDLLCLADPRQGEADLRQIFGRGERNNLEIYPDKILHIIIPVYKDELFNENKSILDGKIEQDATEIEVLDEDGNTRKQQLQEDSHKGFENFKNFLLFILSECGKDIINGFIVNSKLKETKEDEIKKPDHIVYNPVNTKNDINPDFKGYKIPIIILKSLSSTYYGKYTNFMGFLRNHGVYNETTYNDLRASNEANEWMLNLGDIRKRYKKFCFKELGAKENAGYYETLEECEVAYKECLRLFAEESNCSISKLKSKKTEQQINKKIFEMNSRIPINRELYYPIV